MTSDATGDEHPDFAGVDVELVMRIYAAMSTARAPLEPSEARKSGVLASRLPVSERDQERHLRDIGRQLPDTNWPERLRAAVVNAVTGELVLLGRADGIPLDVGVAASCAAPGLVAPVTLERTPHVDGGARSATNADVLARFDVSRALAVSPIPKSTPMVGESAQRVLEEESRRLNDVRIDVATIVPSELPDEVFDLGDVEKIPL